MSWPFDIAFKKISKHFIFRCCSFTQLSSKRLLTLTFTPIISSAEKIIHIFLIAHVNIKWQEVNIFIGLWNSIILVESRNNCWWVFVYSILSCFFLIHVFVKIGFAALFRFKKGSIFDFFIILQKLHMPLL